MQGLGGREAQTRVGRRRQLLQGGESAGIVEHAEGLGTRLGAKALLERCHQPGHHHLVAQLAQGPRDGGAYDDVFGFEGLDQVGNGAGIADFSQHAGGAGDDDGIFVTQGPGHFPQQHLFAQSHQGDDEGCAHAAFALLHDAITDGPHEARGTQLEPAAQGGQANAHVSVVEVTNQVGEDVAHGPKLPAIAWEAATRAAGCEHNELRRRRRRAIRRGMTTEPPLPSLQPFYQEIAPLSAKQRLDHILGRKDIMRVVRQMPVPDLFSTVKDIGVEDALELLELMSPLQVQGFLDLDAWRRDRVDAASLGRWMRVFFAANPDRCVGQLRGLDLELLTLILKINTRIYDLSLEEEPEHDVGRHSITPDQRYLIVYGGVVADDETQAVLQQIVDRMMGRDMLFVLKLCEAIRAELPSQLEEDAYRWRCARLADLGFLPAHEAAEIFAWLDPEQPLPGTRPPAPPPLPHDEATSTNLTASVLLPWGLLSGGNDVLSRALQGLDQPSRERVAHELMLTANRVHAADGQDLGDTDALKETARHVTATAGTGLAFLVKGTESELTPALATTSVMLLFRLGHSLSLKLAQDLRARVRVKAATNTPTGGLDGRGLLRLDAPLREVVAGFLRPRPVLFAGLLDPRRVDYRPVASLNELAAAASALSEAAFRAALLDRLGANDAFFADVDDADLPAHGAIFGSFLAHGLRTGAPHLGLVRCDDLAALAAAAAATLPTSLLSELDDKVRGLAPLPGAATAVDVVARTRTFALQVWSAVVDELKTASPEAPPTSLWTDAPRRQDRDDADDSDG